MSDPSIMHDHEDIPRFEPWLGVMLCAFLPVCAALILPATFLAPMFALATGFFLAGMVMLRRQSRMRGARQPDTRSRS